jgi:hypothetical protein
VLSVGCTRIKAPLYKIQEFIAIFTKAAYFPDPDTDESSPRQPILFLYFFNIGIKSPRATLPAEIFYWGF